MARMAERINKSKKLSMKVDFLLKFIGCFFFLIGIMGIILSIKIGSFDKVFWFCYIGLILMGIGAFRKDSNLITSQVNIMTIPLIIWSIDFFSILFFKISLFKISEYFFSPGFSFLSRLISLQHLITLPLAFYCIYIIGLNRKDNWKISFFEIFLIFIIST